MKGQLVNEMKGRVIQLYNPNSSCIKIGKQSQTLPWTQLPYPMTQPNCQPPKCDDQWPPTHNEPEVCPPPFIPNPIFPVNATLPLLTPLAVTQTGNTVFVTASIPAEAIITLPTHATEIKRISKKLKITQCRFFNAPAPIIPGQPVDTPKLFLGGFVRKDIQYSEMKHKTHTTVEGDIRDFLIDIPVSGVINLGSGLVIPALQFDQEQEYEYARRSPLGHGFPEKERLLGPDLTEFNTISNKFLNRLPFCELVYSQINDMNDQLDRVPLCGGPFEEGIFRTIQEKMSIVVQIAITFQPTLISC